MLGQSEAPARMGSLVEHGVSTPAELNISLGCK